MKCVLVKLKEIKGLRKKGIFSIVVRRHSLCQKEHNINNKFVGRSLIRNASHFYGLPLDLCGKRIAALFAKRAAIFATHHIFTGKVPQSLEKCHNPWIAALYKTAHFQE